MTIELRKDEETRHDPVEEVHKLKETLAYVLSEKALETNDIKTGSFYYLVSRILRTMPVVYHHDPKLILATDGERLYVGPLYNTLKKKVIKTSGRKEWRKLSVALILHEVLHILYGHPSRIKLVDDPELYNIVTDLYVNTLIEERMKWKIPDDFVTLRSLVSAITEKYGDVLSDKAKETLMKIAEYEVSDKLSVEQVYEIISSLGKEIVQYVKQNYGSGYFFGHDLADKTGERYAKPSRRTTSRETTTKQAGSHDKKQENREGETSGKLGSTTKEKDKKKPETGEEATGEQEGASKHGEAARKTSKTGKTEKEERGKSGKKGKEKDSEKEKSEGKEGEETKEGKDQKKRADAGAGKGEEEKEETKKPDIIDFGKSAKSGEDISKTLKSVRDEISRTLEEIRQTLGEYRALKHTIDKLLEEQGQSWGTAPGVMGIQEYREMRALTIPIELQFLREVGETVSDTRVTYTHYDEDAYWLPASEEVKRNKVLALIDSSPSIPSSHLNLFANLVRKAMEVYDIEYEISVFSVGEVDHKIISLDNLDKAVLNMPRGFGTVWEKTIAERIRKATEEGVRLIQVLSDFYIGVDPVVLEEIKRFKAMGGKIACYSTTGVFLDVCDFKHHLPRILKSLR